MSEKKNGKRYEKPSETVDSTKSTLNLVGCTWIYMDNNPGFTVETNRGNKLSSIDMENPGENQ
jgi:hypothetical protein